MQLRLPARRVTRSWLAIAIACTTLAVGALGVFATPGEIPPSFFVIEDVDGANDVVAQSDLSQLGRDDTDPNYYKLFWSWDEMDQWTGTGQTGDACALFDSDGDGKINVAVCAQIHNKNADPTFVEQTTAGSPYVFRCGDTKNDRCAQPNGPIGRTPSQVTAGVIGSETSGILDATGNLITDTDPFDATDLNGPGDDSGNDSTIQISILKSYLNTQAYPPSGTPPSGQSVSLVNVCSYPSAGNGGNNNPFDCITTPGSGFLKIVKQTPLGTSGSFILGVSPNPTGTQPNSYTLVPQDDVTAARAETAPIGMLITTSAVITETSLPTGWDITGASCTIAGVAGTHGTYDDANKRISGVTINSGKLTTCTITNNPINPTLSLRKVVVNDNGGNNAASTWTLTADAATGADLSSTGTQHATLNEATYGPNTAQANVQYTLSESTVSGYTSDGVWSCTGGTFVSPNKVTLPYGAAVTCSITNNDVPASLTLRKLVVTNNGGNNNASEWTLTAATGGPSGHGAPATGSEATITQAVSANTIFTLSESGGPSGYSSNGQWVCVGGNMNATTNTVRLNEGESATCTITNDDVAPQLTLIKDVINDNNGNATSDQFGLTIDGSAAISGTAYAVSANAGHVINEAGLTGYAFKNIDGNAKCPAALLGTVTLDEGENITCTIHNDDVAPTLVLKKIVVNDNSGNNNASEWTLVATGTGGFSGTGLPATGSEATKSSSVRANTTYTLSESGGPSGYTSNGEWSCDGGTMTGTTQVTLDEGVTVTCSITNNDVAPTLTLVKDVLNDNGGNAGAGDFGLTIGGTAATSSQAYTVSSNTPYAITEAGLAGYTFVNITGPSECPAALAGTVTLDEGENITCTIHNDDVAPTLILKKIVVNDNGGNNNASEWTLVATGTDGFSGTGLPATGSPATKSGTVRSNATYTLSESGGPSGYSSTGLWTCDGGHMAGTTNSVSLDEGTTVTCEITNDDVAPTLKLIKDVINDDGGNATENDFGLTIDGGAAISGTAYTVTANSGHAINEAGLAGYDFSSISGPDECPALLEGTVTLDEGENITCTIHNDDVAPTLTLVKIVVNDNGMTNLADEWTLTATPASGDPISGEGDQDDVDNEAVFGPSDAASNVEYELSESGPDDYDAGSWSCSVDNGDAVIGDTLTLNEGESAVCTITNDDTRAEPDGTTVQHWVLHDTLTFVDLRAGGGPASITFELFNNATCSSDNDGLVGFEVDSSIVAGQASTTLGVTVNESGTYYWVASYSGNQNNEAFSTACGEEITQILAKDAHGPSGRNDFLSLD